MASIVLLLMGGESQHSGGISALRDAGHELTVVEPRFPECKQQFEGPRPQLVIVDGVAAPSHGRATAAWLSSLSRFRVVPFLFLDVPDKDVARVKKELPRAQFGTWAGVVGASERLVQRQSG
jgi:hypothetical protein